MQHVVVVKTFGLKGRFKILKFDVNEYSKDEVDAFFVPYTAYDFYGHPYTAFDYLGEKLYHVRYMGVFSEDKIPYEFALI